MAEAQGPGRGANKANTNTKREGGGRNPGGRRRGGGKERGRGGGGGGDQQHQQQQQGKQQQGKQGSSRKEGGEVRGDQAKTKGNQAKPVSGGGRRERNRNRQQQQQQQQQQRGDGAGGRNQTQTQHQGGRGKGVGGQEQHQHQQQKGGGATGGQKKSGGRSRNRGPKQQQPPREDPNARAAARKERERREAEERERERLRLEREEAEREAKRRAEDAADRIRSHLASLKDACSRLEASADLSRRRAELRAANSKPARPTERELTKLDSSVKRNTTLNKKLRCVTEETKESVLADVSRANQRKYVTEAAAAVGEVLFKQKDVSAVAEVCSAMHSKYDEFASALLPQLAKVARGEVGQEGLTLTRKRNALRLIVELLVVGVHTNAGPLERMVEEICEDVGEVSTAEEEEQQQEQQQEVDQRAQNALAMLATFAKHGREEVLGTPSPAPALGPEPEDGDYEEGAGAEGGCPTREEVAKARARLGEAGDAAASGGGGGGSASWLPEDSRARLRDLVLRAYGVGVGRLASRCLLLRRMEQSNRRVLHVKGELTDTQRERVEQARKVFDSLQRSVASLADSLGEDLPPLPEEELTRVADGGSEGVVVARMAAGSGEDAEGGAFDDEETRAFYEDLPDIRAQLPDVLVASSSQAPAAPAKPGEGGQQLEEEGNLRQDQQLKLEDLLNLLRSCGNKEAADSCSLELCYLGLRSVRKRVTKELFSCPRQRLDLLPHFSRVCANLTRVHLDVGPSLVRQLEEEFAELSANTSLHKDESRVRNARFIGELTKFRVFPFSSTFACVRTLLDDFGQKAIETLCVLLETCGRFLYRTPETAVRMANVLEVLTKKRKTRNLDPRSESALENAYFATKPPEKSVTVAELPPLHRYCEHLVFARLARGVDREVARQCRKLPLHDPECRDFLLQTLLSVTSVRVACIPLLASVVSQLSRYQDDLAVDYVDAVLEEVHSGLRRDDCTEHQRRVSYAILLGEVLNARLVDAPVVLQTLYIILLQTKAGEQNTQVPAEGGSKGEAKAGKGKARYVRGDRVSALFRARLVLVLLTTCGRTLQRRATAARLDYFLLRFQHFVLQLGGLPYELQYDVQALFKQLRPRMPVYSSLEECAEAVEAAGRERPTDLLRFLQDRKSGEVAASLRAVQEDTDTEEEEPSETDEDEDEREEVSESEEEEAARQEVDDAQAALGSDTDESGTYSDTDSSSGEEEEEEEEEEVLVNRNLDHLKPSREEEERLEREFEQMMQESLSTAKFAAKPSNANLPSANRAVLNKFRHQHGSGHQGGAAASDALSSSGAGQASGTTTHVQFQVMLKKGTKAAVRDLQVPREAMIAQANDARRQEEAAEKMEIKRLVLEASEREEGPVQLRKYAVQPARPLRTKPTERW